MYGFDVLSSFDIVNGYNKPIYHSFLHQVTTEDLFHVRNELKAKRKVTLMLPKYATKDTFISPGDLVDVFVEKDEEKFVMLLSPRFVLLYDQSSETIKVTGSSGRVLFAAVEDVRLSTYTDGFAKHSSGTNDQLSGVTEELVSKLDTLVDEANNSTDYSITNFQSSRDEKSI